MLPEAGRVPDLKVSKRSQTLSEELVGKDACLWEAVDSFLDFQVDEPIVRMLV